MKRFPGRGYARWGTEEKAIYIGNLPHRKQVCLYGVNGSVLDVLAYFKTHKKAQTALDWLDYLADSGRPGEDEV